MITPDNIEESWPQDIVKCPGNTAGHKNEETFEMKVKMNKRVII
jgi:hypothetical protein